jgi:GTP cyclohydrolase I
MNKIVGATVAGLSLATVIAFGVPKVQAQEKTIPCRKVMEALNGPDMRPRDVAASLHIPLHAVHQCMDMAKTKMGTSHVAVGPGGAGADPNDPATKFKEGPW